MYRALDTVAREMSGGIMAATRDSTAEAVAVGQEIDFPVTPTATIRDIEPAAAAPSASGDVIGNRKLKITKCRAGDIIWSGNEGIAVGGSRGAIVQNQIEQRIRAIVNEIETDVVTNAVTEGVGAFYTVGTAGTTPFASNLNVLTAGLKQLKDKGSPESELQAVINTSAGENLRNLSNLQKVNESGNDSLLRQGMLGRLMGFDVRESAGFKNRSGGSGYLANGGESAGATSVTVDSGSGKVEAGSIVKFGSDTTLYVVAEDMASGGTELKLTQGLKADVADNATVTVVSTLPSVLFPRSNIWLATRTVPNGGDSAAEVRTITDPRTGLSFTASLYREYKRTRLEIGMAWGVGTIKPEWNIPILG